MYGLHPLLPAVWLLVFVQGLVVPAIYFLVQKMPARVDMVWDRAKDGKAGAKLVVASWLATAMACAFAVLLVLLR